MKSYLLLVLKVVFGAILIAVAVVSVLSIAFNIIGILSEFSCYSLGALVGSFLILGFSVAGLVKFTD